MRWEFLREEEFEDAIEKSGGTLRHSDRLS